MKRGRKLNNLSGQRFGMLTVVERSADKNKVIYYLCKCDCGKERIIRAGNLRSGNTKSCGCSNKGGYLDITGEKFGRLTVIKRAKRPKQCSQGTYWLCKCECGQMTIVDGGQIKIGNTLSCGCYRREQSSIRNLINLTGKRYGKWTVIKRVKNHPINEEPKWLCECMCGKRKVVFGSNLRSGTSKSCGCKRNTKKKVNKEQ